MTSEAQMTIAESHLRELLDACLLWCEDRAIDPGDVPAMYLKATIAQMFPEIVNTRETCECGGDCEECPTRADVVRSIDECKREAQQYLQKRALQFMVDESKREADAA